MASLVCLNQVSFNQTALQLNTAEDLTKVLPESPAYVSGWQKATGCAAGLSLQRKGGLCLMKERQRGENKSKNTWVATYVLMSFACWKLFLRATHANMGHICGTQ